MQKPLLLRIALKLLHLLLGHKSVLNELFKPTFLNLMIKIFQKLKPRGLVRKWELLRALVALWTMQNNLRTKTWHNNLRHGPKKGLKKVSIWGWTKNRIQQQQKKIVLLESGSRQSLLDNECVEELGGEPVEATEAIEMTLWPLFLAVLLDPLGCCRGCGGCWGCSTIDAEATTFSSWDTAEAVDKAE